MYRDPMLGRPDYPCGLSFRKRKVQPSCYVVVQNAILCRVWTYRIDLLPLHIGQFDSVCSLWAKGLYIALFCYAEVRL